MTLANESNFTLTDFYSHTAGLSTKNTTHIKKIWDKKKTLPQWQKKGCECLLEGN